MINIPAVMERCAGIDVGKRELAVALVVGPADKDGEVTTRAYGTTVPELEKLRQWLIQEGCTSVAILDPGEEHSGGQRGYCAGLREEAQTGARP